MDYKRLRNKAKTEYLRSRLRDVVNVQDDGELVSVCIPIREPDLKYLDWTIKSVRENAGGPVDIIVACDGFRPSQDINAEVICFDDAVGQRHAMNVMAVDAEGKYLFRLDGHCKLSPQWDSRMKKSCKDKTVVTTVFDHLDENFESIGSDLAFVKIRDDYRTFYLKKWKRIIDRNIEEETMGFSGCSWMITKDFYDKIGGSDEKLGGWGGIGSELALKTWLTGGRCIIRTDVTTYHLFRNQPPFEIDQKQRAAAFMMLKEKFPDINWLKEKFRKELSTVEMVKFIEVSEQYDALVRV